MPSSGIVITHLHYFISIRCRSILRSSHLSSTRTQIWRESTLVSVACLSSFLSPDSPSSLLPTGTRDGVFRELVVEDAADFGGSSPARGLGVRRDRFIKSINYQVAKGMMQSRKFRRESSRRREERRNCFPLPAGLLYVLTAPVRHDAALTICRLARWSQ